MHLFMIWWLDNSAELSWDDLFLFFIVSANLTHTSGALGGTLPTPHVISFHLTNYSEFLYTVVKSSQQQEKVKIWRESIFQTLTSITVDIVSLNKQVIWPSLDWRFREADCTSWTDRHTGSCDQIWDHNNNLSHDLQILIGDMRVS